MPENTVINEENAPGECAVQEISVPSRALSTVQGCVLLPWPPFSLAAWSTVHALLEMPRLLCAMHLTVDPLDGRLLDIIIKGCNGTSLASGG